MYFGFAGFLLKANVTADVPFVSRQQQRLLLLLD